MKQKLIKVINSNKADNLVKLGFSYIKEKINNQNVYVFTESPEILKYLQSNFDKCDFMIDNTLRF